MAVTGICSQAGVTDTPNRVAGDAPIISTAGSNTYFYTDEFAVAPGDARATLKDSNGGNDVLNAAAVSTGMKINLNNDTTSLIAGRNLTVSGDIEQPSAAMATMN